MFLFELIKYSLNACFPLFILFLFYTIWHEKYSTISLLTNIFDEEYNTTMSWHRHTSDNVFLGPVNKSGIKTVDRLAPVNQSSCRYILIMSYCLNDFFFFHCFFFLINLSIFFYLFIFFLISFSVSNQCFLRRFNNR